MAELKTFLSPKKSFIYLSISLIGLILKFLALPGNTFILLGLGLFYGHLCYRSVKFPHKQLMKIFIMLFATLGICILVLSLFNTLPAAIVILISVIISLLTEFLTVLKKKV